MEVSKEMEVSKDIKYVGVSDKDVDLFEGQYPVPDGITYNSYVIMDEKIAIMDTVDARKSKEWLDNLSAALDGKTPDYLVVSHVEPDHAGSIAAMVSRYPDITIVTNAKAFNMIGQFFDIELNDNNKLTVAEGDTLSLGEHTLTFVMAPMVHWPEVMVEYEQKEKILFSADGFGTFGTTPLYEDEWTPEAARYYVNICGKYGVQVQNLLKKAAALDIEMICPLHGPVLKENLGYYIGKYDIWSKYEPELPGVLVAYGSLHGNTREAALLMAEELKKNNVAVSVRDLARDDMSYIIADAFRYGSMVLAAPTYDAGLFPKMDDFLNHLKAKNYSKRTVALIENGTWAPMAAKHMKAALEQFKEINICDKTVTIKSAVNEQNKADIRELAGMLA